MEIIDDEGRLFGVVNVIDVLVVLLILAVLIAGIALLNPFASPEQQQTDRYATVDLGEQQPFVAEQISVGDVTGGATVTDVHVGPAGGANVSVTARIRINGSLSEDGESFSYRGDPVRRGSNFTLETTAYTANGTITRLETEGAKLDTVTRQVRLDGTLSSTAAERLQSGATVTYAGREGATVESIYIGPGSDPRNRHVTATVTVEALRQSGGLTFGDQPVQLGRSLSLDFGEYGLSGTIQGFGEPAETATTQVALQATVSTTVANAIETGDTFEFGGQSIATVQTMDVYPTGDASTRRVLLGMDLETVTRNADTYFGTNRVTLGSTIPFEADAYRLSGTVIGRGAYAPSGSVATETISVKVANVEPEFADGIEVGMTEESLGRTTAEIVDKRTEPASVILTSEQGEIFERTHPRNEDVYLTVDVTVRETADGYQFHAQSLKEGNRITLDFRTITVRGTVTDI